jgi:DNA-binding transcriptional LysR family regulator
MVMDPPGLRVEVSGGPGTCKTPGSRSLSKASGMRLRQLEYFVAVAEEHHFGRAAERLRVAQPGVSQQIKILERSLGAQLFVRGSGGVELTEAGDALLDHARLVLELVERTGEIPRLVAAGKAGLLKVGTAAIHMLPVANQVIADFRERFPSVDVHLHPGFGSTQIDLLRRRMLDATFVSGPFDDAEGLRYLALGALEIRVALPETHPLAALDGPSPAELLKERFISLPRAVDPSFVDHARAQVFGEAEPPDSVEVADTTLETRLRMVAEGEGFTLTTRPEETDLPIPGVVYRHIARRTPTVDYGLAWLDSSASSFVTSLVETAERVLTELRIDDAPRRRTGRAGQRVRAS